MFRFGPFALTAYPLKGTTPAGPNLGRVGRRRRFDEFDVRDEPLAFPRNDFDSIMGYRIPFQRATDLRDRRR
jgi:hypothetical protein